MKIALKILSVIILLQSCKLASFEKRRYRTGYFVSGHHKAKTEPQKSIKQGAEKPVVEVVKTKPTETKETTNIISKPSEASASAEPGYKTNVNKLLPIRTTFVNDRLKDHKKHFKKSKKTKQKRSGDDLILHLFLLAIIVIWLAISLGIKLLLPSLPIQYCYGISAVIVLALIILLFVGVKKSSYDPI